MAQPRSASASGEDFPYELATTCYIEVHADGAVSQGAGTYAYQRAVAGASRLFAVWPGNWSSDLFAIDDLDAYARAVGVIYDHERTGLAEHQHTERWQSTHEQNPQGSYVSIDVFLDWGCTIRDLKAFATHMRDQQGWDVATSGGYSGHGDQFTIQVRRRSLTP